MPRKDQSNIEILLGDWGAWKFRENRCAVGYPSISALARMRVDCSSSKDLPDFVVDDDILRLDIAREPTGSRSPIVYTPKGASPGEVVMPTVPIGQRPFERCALAQRFSRRTAPVIARAVNLWVRPVAETLMSAIKRQALVTDHVIVSYSGGKDSAVTLDLCTRHFKRVDVFFMYQVQGLSFQEQVLQWAERRYGVEIYRIPHFELSDFYRYGVLCKPDFKLPKVSVSDVYAHVRQAFDGHWIAAGERAKDSIVRNAMIKRSGSPTRLR
ncbi:MAG: phosphoadenosine phosphosulfate reductase family protein [Comamonadaceae bacterium]|nr:phosphoadenosine phosphosulfate reductase family protein [Comamonadaceae bacterium]